MAAVTETVARVRDIDVDKYKYGFTTKIAVSYTHLTLPTTPYV